MKIQSLVQTYSKGEVCVLCVFLYQISCKQNNHKYGRGKMLKVKSLKQNCFKITVKLLIHLKTMELETNCSL